MKQVILTGDRPTGRLHVGHYVGSLKERVRLQNSGKFDEIYIMIADAQALTDNAEHPEKVRQNIMQVALDYLACGLDPEKVNIFIQSMVPELTELSFYYMNLVTVARVQRNPTVKAEIKQKNFEASIPVGFFTYPISQAADITAFRATVVPAGEDQMPMVEQCKEIVHKFNSVYGETLTDPQIVLPDNQACLRLPGIDGKAKMSKSLGNCIYLSDEPQDIKKKVMSMFTDPNHLRVEDPGQVEGNPVFIYLDAFCKPEYFEEFWPEYNNLDELKAHYQRGGLGDATRAIQLLLTAPKEYVCVMTFHHEVDEDKIREVFNEFTGKIFQLPPVKSAVKRELRSRNVYYSTIYEINGRDVLFRIGCEAGTYVRTYCHNIGEAIGVGAHMAELRRTQVGSFTEDNHLSTLQDVTDAYHFYKEDGDESFLRKAIMPMERAADYLPKVVIKDSAVDAICHGANLASGGIAYLSDNIQKNSIVAIETLKGELVASGNSLFSSDEILNLESGFAVNVSKVFMKTDIYPKMWK